MYSTQERVNSPAFSMFIQEVESSELAELLRGDSKIRLIDVRSPGEIMAGIIPGAAGMPLNLLPLRMSEVPKDQQVVFYCRTGARSAQACLFMMQHGYNNVYNLRGGIISWAQNGQSIVPGFGVL